MKRCGKCRVDFTGDLDRCPLCQAELKGDPTPAVFPRNEVRKSGALALRVLAFATGVCLLVMLFLGPMLSLPLNIVATVCLALVVNYLFVRNILTHNPDFLRMIARYFLVLLAFATIWFIATGNLAVTTFIIPGICFVALIYDTVLVSVFRGTFVSGYAKYLLFDIALGLMPLALVALNLTSWDMPAYISALTACIFSLGLLMFMRKQIVEEIQKLFSA